MAPYENQLENTGSFVPTTNIWEAQQFLEVDLNSQDFRQLLVRLYQNISNIAVALNTKDSAFYTTNQFVTGQVWFDPLSSNFDDSRTGFRIVVNMGPLNAGITTKAHGLPAGATWKFTYIGGVATNTGTLNYYPLPFAGVAGNNIELRVDGANVIINNNSGATFTDAYVVLEFLKT